MHLQADNSSMADSSDGSISVPVDEDEKRKAQEVYFQSQIAQLTVMLQTNSVELEKTNRLYFLSRQDLEKCTDDLRVATRAKSDLTRQTEDLTKQVEAQEKTLRNERAQNEHLKAELEEERALTQRLRGEIQLLASRLREVAEERLHLVRKAACLGESPPDPLGWEKQVIDSTEEVQPLTKLSSFLSNSSSTDSGGEASKQDSKGTQSLAQATLGRTISAPSRPNSTSTAAGDNTGLRTIFLRALGRGGNTEEEFRQLVRSLGEIPPARSIVRGLTTACVDRLRQAVVCVGDRTGTPESARGYLWAECVGNHLGISENLFGRVQRKRDKIRDAWTRIGEQQQQDDEASIADWKIRPRTVTAKTVFSQTASAYVPGIEEEELFLLGSAFEQIPLDVNRTFTAKDLETLDYHEPIAEEIRDLLEAFAVLKPEFGYTQGMNFVAALMVMIFPDPFRAFVCFSNAMILQPWLTACYTFNMSVVNTYFEVFDDLLLTYLPRLGKHFQQQDLKSDLYLVEWWFTLFAKSLPLPIVVRIWDSFFLEGEFLLYRASLAILQCFSDALLARPRDECLALLSTWPAVQLDPARLFENMDRMGLTEKKLVSSYEKVRKRRSQNDIAA